MCATLAVGISCLIFNSRDIVVKTPRLSSRMNYSDWLRHFRSFLVDFDM